MRRQQAQNEIQALVVVLFPEFTQVFADPCGQTALAVLKAFPCAQAVAEAGVEPLFQLLRAQKPARLWLTFDASGDNRKNGNTQQKRKM